MPLPLKKRILLRIAAWALRNYWKTRNPSPPEEPTLLSLLKPPRLESTRQTTHRSPAPRRERS